MYQVKGIVVTGNQEKENALKAIEHWAFDGADALAAMQSHPWPGNVRELENKVKRAVIMSGKKTLTPADPERRSSRSVFGFPC
jgi:transcriptional regulator with AAA-type ATPase domain